VGRGTLKDQIRVPGDKSRGRLGKGNWWMGQWGKFVSEGLCGLEIMEGEN